MGFLKQKFIRKIAVGTFYLFLVFLFILLSSNRYLSSEKASGLSDSQNHANEIIDKDFKTASEKNTQEAYNDFLIKYPYVLQVEEIKKRRELLDTFNVDNNFKFLQLLCGNGLLAYQEKESEIIKLLNNAQIDHNSLEIYIRTIKSEEILEVWARDRRDNHKYKFLKKYKVCIENNIDSVRGTDLLIPESFYYFSNFYPGDPYFIRLEINFPNQSDIFFGREGGDISIHGGCFSTYCTALSDDDIKEIFILAVEAKSKGQNIIEVHNYPARLDEKNFMELAYNSKYSSDKDRIDLWRNMKASYQYFEEHRKLLKYTVDSNGKFIYSE